MTEPETKIAVLKNEQENQERRLSSLESNQRWVVLGIIGATIKAAFDLLKGVGQ